VLQRISSHATFTRGKRKTKRKNSRDGFLSLVMNFSYQLLPLILRPSRRAGWLSVATIFDIASDHFGKALKRSNCKKHFVKYYRFVSICVSHNELS